MLTATRGAYGLYETLWWAELPKEGVPGREHEPIWMRRGTKSLNTLLEVYKCKNDFSF
ncbi:MAG: hypothetical protein QOJ65_193 [Fimbriimonadaceae bacterium]|jgi:hypothetical protein|nr:hypothetical protein [Fimbriimonadaceae bacterium]